MTKQCKCGCEIKLETDIKRETAIKCFKCGEKIKFKGQEL